MFLSKLELCGFKSFVQKTDVRFKEGMMAVVGPNGCGKSNIVDSIRWVMGEQRPSVLRCSAMEDIVFNGSKNRKPIGMAEVSITIENTRNILPIEYNEVTITRRLYRSGESEYLINKNVCRLKDITNLFMDTGMGAQSYSVIEQSMEDALLSDKTENRRMLFDEASGIMKYKTRQKETLRKLAQTSEDLVRLNDILLEVEKKTESLKRQVTKAEKFKEFTGELKKLDLYLAKHRHQDLAGQLAPAQARGVRLEQEIAECDQVLAKDEAHSEALKLDLLERERSLSSSQVQVDTAVQQIQELEKQLVAHRERRLSLEGIIQRLQTEVETARQQCVGYAGELAEAQTTELAAGQERDAMAALVQTNDASFQEFEKIYREKKERIDSQRSQLWRQLDLFSQESQDLQKAIAEKENAERRLARVNEERAQIESQLTEVEARLTALRTQRQELSETLTYQNQEHESIAAARKGRQEVVEALRLAEGEVVSQIKAREFNLSILEKIKANYEGFTTGVRSLINNQQEMGGIRRVVADVIHTPKEYAQALESALGHSLQYLISDSIGTAHQAIDYLGKNNMGKATLIANDHFNTLEMTINYPALLQEDGVLGAAWDLVESETEYANIVKYLLQDVIIVRDLDTAFRLLDKNYGPHLRYVTPHGEILQSNGILTGGSAADDHHLIGRDDEIAELKRAVAALTTERTEKQQRIDAENRELDELSRRVQGIDELIGQAQHGLTTLDKELIEVEIAAKNLHARNDQLTEEQGQLEEQLLAGMERIETLEREMRQFNREESEQEIRQHETELAQLEQERDTLIRQLQQQQIRLTELESEVRRARTEHENRQRRLTEAEARIAADNSEAVRSIEQVLGLDHQIREQETSLQTLFAGRRELEARRDNSRAEYQTLFAAVDGLEKAIRQNRKTREELQSNFHGQALEAQRLSLEIGNLEETIRAAYQVELATFDAAALDAEFTALGLAMAELDARHQELKDKLDKLGPVNLLALEEYETENGRLDFLQKQYADLVEAKDTLEKTLQKINKTAREQFVETFEKIRQNFEWTYAKFFDGGSAKLSLEEGVDLLDADVIIQAQPLGKNLRHISLLSGGERALTAIALLFAIYLVKPSPFCILDEVDAPLDDANVGRFLNVIKEFSKQTQFLMVTHNKRTMETADCLYGITMPEQGVSQVVSVRF
jgi:chromosome segregation protein